MSRKTLNKKDEYLSIYLGKYSSLTTGVIDQS